MRLLIHSNAPWVQTGYGRQTRLLARALQTAGHPTAVSCFYGLHGALLEWDGITCYPQGFETASSDIVSAHAEHFKADMILTLTDAWVLPIETWTRPVISYYPVDMEPLPRPVWKQIRHARLRVAMSRFGQEMTAQAGLDAAYAPHMYDAAVYYPRTGEIGRRHLKIENGQYLVGVVAANKGVPPRKAWPQLFEAFASFHRHHPESVLYVHAHLGKEHQGVDLKDLRRYYGIPDAAWRSAEQYQHHVGLYGDDFMAELYSAVDVLMLCSLGEGFGIPLLEAQACGTPVVTGEWTAMGELCRTGFALEKSMATKYHTPDFGDGWLADPGCLAVALGKMREEPPDPVETSRRVSEWRVDEVMSTYWNPIIDALARAEVTA